MSELSLPAYLALAFLLPVITAFIGASLRYSHERLCALISLGAGTLLGVTFFEIVPEGLAVLRPWELTTAFLSGYLLFYYISKYVYHVCPACAASHFDEATTRRFTEVAAMMMVALGLHCAMDGVALAAGHEAELAGNHALDLSLLLAVAIHKVPEGLALGALLLGAGYDRRHTVTQVALVEALTPLGGILAIVLLGVVSPLWVYGAIVHVGGGFLFLAIHAVMGEMVKHHRVTVLVNFAIGFILIALLSRLAG